MALAVQILDGAPFRPGGKIPMSVTQAKFEQKGHLFIYYQLINKLEEYYFLFLLFLHRRNIHCEENRQEQEEEAEESGAEDSWMG